MEVSSKELGTIETVCVGGPAHGVRLRTRPGVDVVNVQTKKMETIRNAPLMMGDQLVDYVQAHMHPEVYLLRSLSLLWPPGARWQYYYWVHESMPGVLDVLERLHLADCHVERHWQPSPLVKYGQLTLSMN